MSWGFHFSQLPLDLQVHLLTLLDSASLWSLVEAIKITGMNLCAHISLITLPIELVKLQRGSSFNILYIKSRNDWTIDHMDAIVFARCSRNLIVLNGNYDCQLFLGPDMLERYRSGWGSTCEFLLTNDSRVDLSLHYITISVPTTIHVCNTNVLTMARCKGTEVLEIQSNNDGLCELSLDDCHPGLVQRMNIKHLNVKVLTLTSSLAYHHVVRNKDFTGINELRLHGAVWLEYCSFSGTSITLDVTPTIKDRLRQRREIRTLLAMREGMLHSMWAPNLRSLDVHTWYEAKLGTFYSPSLTMVKIRHPEKFGSAAALLSSNFTQELDYSYLTENDNILELELNSFLAPLMRMPAGRSMANLEILTIRNDQSCDSTQEYECRCKVQLPRLKKLILFDAESKNNRWGTILMLNAPHLKTLVINSFLFLSKLIGLTEPGTQNWPDNCDNALPAHKTPVHI